MPVTIKTSAMIAVDISERNPKLTEIHWIRILRPKITPPMISDNAYHEEFFQAVVLHDERDDARLFPHTRG